MKKNSHLEKFAFWIILAIVFNMFIYLTKGKGIALDFFGGYVIELTLSLDNLFLFLMIFASFGIPMRYQERVLKYGIIGAVILRLVFILLGVTIVNKFHWIIYVFGIILFISGLKMLFQGEDNRDFKNSKFVKCFNKIIPITNVIEDEKFFVIKNKILYATPLFIILLLIESSDIIFALDSIPAIFSITTDPFIVFTSNIFAILGLRSMYFILARMNSRFKYMKYGVTFILMFTGVKLILLYFNLTISTIVSVLIILILILSSILVSLLISDPVN